MPDKPERLRALGKQGPSPDEIANRNFPTVRKGLDPEEVRRYLEQVARAMASALERETDLMRRLEIAEEKAAHPSLDEDTLMKALGEETARVLRSAREAASEVRERASQQAEEILHQARSEAESMLAKANQDAENRSKEAARSADAILQRAQRDAEVVLEQARQRAESLVASAREEASAMIQDAKMNRTRILEDLAQKRKVLHAQVEQLKAGKDTLLEAVKNVRTSIEQAEDSLVSAEERARQEASQARRRAELEVEKLPEELGLLPGPTPTEAGQVKKEGPAKEDGPDKAGKTKATQMTPSKEHALERASELFERLRSEIPSLAGEPIETEKPVQLPEPSPGAPADPSTSLGVQPSSSRALALQEHTEPQKQSEAVPESSGATQNGSVGPIATALRERDELTDPLIGELSRALKRALNDEHNEVLDRIRQGEFGSVESLLGSNNAQMLRYGDALRGPIKKSVLAARRYLDKRGISYDQGEDKGEEVAASAACEASKEVVSSIRRELEEKLGEVSGDQAATMEAVGGIYRKWRSERISRVAGDAVTNGFSTVIASAKGAVGLRWIVDDGGILCPDCDDNALAGLINAGDPFPTGHLHPPAHPGCRCLIQPERL